MSRTMFGIPQHTLKSARELMLEANFSHDSMMAHLKAIYESRKATYWFISEVFYHDAN